MQRPNKRPTRVRVEIHRQACDVVVPDLPRAYLRHLALGLVDRQAAFPDDAQRGALEPLGEVRPSGVRDCYVIGVDGAYCAVRLAKLGQPVHAPERADVEERWGHGVALVQAALMAAELGDSGRVLAVHQEHLFQDSGYLTLCDLVKRVLEVQEEHRSCVAMEGGGLYAVPLRDEAELRIMVQRGYNPGHPGQGSLYGIVLWEPDTAELRTLFDHMVVQGPAQHLVSSPHLAERLFQNPHLPSQAASAER